MLLRLLALFVCYALFDGSGISALNRGTYDIVEHGVKQFLTTGVEPPYLRLAARNIPFTEFFSHEEKTDLPTDFVCTLCKEVVSSVLTLVRIGADINVIGEQIEELCGILNVETPRVCAGTIALNLGLVNYIIDNKDDLTSERICGLLFQDGPCNNGNNYNWTITIPPGQSLPRPKPTVGDVENIQVLHISDIHYDPNYTPNGNAVCGEPICCQPDQSAPVSPGDACGFWLDYRKSGPPLNTIKEVLKQTTTHKPDYVYFTGDIISHRVWSTSVENNTKSITTIFDLFNKQYDVPVYPIFGNHEPTPLNVWAPSDVTDPMVSTQWLLQLMADQLSWLPEDATKTILAGGYYTVVPRAGFRVIALNTNVCYTFNWWLIYQDYDPYGQLEWLVKVLGEAELNNESVHLIYHVGPGNSECLSAYSTALTSIISRYANTITGQFYGHSHKDEFKIFYNDSDSTQAVSVAHNGAAITTYTDSNPSYKVYQVDGATYKLLDIEEFTFNLTEANLQPDQPLNWYQLYSFRDEYGLDSLEPSDVNELVVRIAQNSTLFTKYYNYKYRMGPGGYETCDDACRKDDLCNIVTSNYGDSSHCNWIMEVYDETKS